MGMEYARLYFDFFTSEKTQYLIDECGDSGPMCLMRLWVRAGQRNNDGVFNKSGRALEKIAGWKGKSGKLIETLTDPDFLFLDKISENEFSLHNWSKNNPHLDDIAIKKRQDKARIAGLASAKKRKEASTTSQLQVNPESTASQLNPTQGQLGSTNVTKRNVTKGNVIKEKNIKKENSDGAIASYVINRFNKITNKKRPVSLNNPTYHKLVNINIKELKKIYGIKEESAIKKDFDFVLDNQKKIADDTEQIWSRYELDTLLAKKNYFKYREADPHNTPGISRPRGREINPGRDAWIDSLPPFIDTGTEYLKADKFAELWDNTPKDKRDPLKEMIQRARDGEATRGGDIARVDDLMSGMLSGKTT